MKVRDHIDHELDQVAQECAAFAASKLKRVVVQISMDVDSNGEVIGTVVLAGGAKLGTRPEVFKKMPSPTSMLNWAKQFLAQPIVPKGSQPKGPVQ